MRPNTLLFPLDDVLALCDHVAAATEHSVIFDKGEPGLVWFKDTGTGLRSSGENPRSEIVWARLRDGSMLMDLPPGDPNFDLTWSTTHDICGGDDFAEKLRLDDDLVAMLRDAKAAGCVWFTIDVLGPGMELGCEFPPSIRHATNEEA